jgi:hypothetical protein
MSALVEIPPVTFTRVEYAYREAKEWRFRGEDHKAQTALRAARARDSRLLKALDQAAEVLVAEHERQLGEYQRRGSIDHAEKSVPTEVAMFREAYRCADQGQPVVQLQWIYAAGCLLAGIII